MEMSLRLLKMIQGKRAFFPERSTNRRSVFSSEEEAEIEEVLHAVQMRKTAAHSVNRSFKIVKYYDRNIRKDGERSMTEENPDKVVANAMLYMLNGTAENMQPKSKLSHMRALQAYIKYRNLLTPESYVVSEKQNEELKEMCRVFERDADRIDQQRETLNLITRDDIRHIINSTFMEQAHRTYGACEIKWPSCSLSVFQVR